MNYTVLAYLLYLPISLTLTIWVARTLLHKGRAIVVVAFRGNEAMGYAVNHLLVAGFCLVTIGFIAVTLRYDDTQTNLQSLFELLSTKLGVVLLILGVMHFFSMGNIDKMSRKVARPFDAHAAPATVPPTLPPR